MCGFAGFISKNTLQNQLVAALNQMQHRGPDYQKTQTYIYEDTYIGFAHARLSIIDLSDSASQPFESTCGKYHIVFNGEIYNYIEIRKELETIGFNFRTNSDTEVLLTAWQHWGVACLQKFIGMFAFVIYDEITQTITLVRDAFGIKPLFYYNKNDELLFGSDIRAVIKLMTEKPQPNLQVAYDYLVSGIYDSNDMSFIQDINHVPPGSFMQYNLAKKVIHPSQKWWSPNISKTTSISFNDAAQRVKELFLESVSYNLRSDVPIGAALSGGVDSSAVVCAMHLLNPEQKIHTFSYIANDEKISEEKWVDGINQYVNASPNKVYADASDIIKDLDHMILMQGEPFGGTSIYAQYRVFQLAKSNNITVTLDGQGADELLAGYSGYPGHRLLSLIENKKYINAIKFAFKWAQWPGRKQSQAWQYFLGLTLPDCMYSFARKLKGRELYPNWLNIKFLEEKEVKFIHKRAARRKENKGKRVREILANSLQYRGLPSLLRHGDRNSMAFTVESRVPFLSLPLVEYLLSLPEEYLISDKGETKSIFRKAMRGVVPDSHLDRKDKIGFETPQFTWLISLESEIKQWITSTPNIPFINKNEILKEFDDVITGTKKFDNRVWRWINYIRWYTLVIEGKNDA
ncbi:asparagine synthase (glutamine-hydrolyzing) [Wohlfahrtiimonas chitiniclastica]|uniref:asparagine synthase (glutamine-hydrolyzing) n=1 Tax=Wohlfahrtiimonas chitiniclastica TaxID=400946 RepID=UPI001BD0DCD6|nr:asparagine synthase (glutamine-hydrolyzing) [Wohlfahrtiimonas chitiniclastica]MBS7828739.1 asparagine synthase (glutamine-hydrolyzing) [Wohlfahrtiimonas chitiniclastica]